MGHVFGLDHIISIFYLLAWMEAGLSSLVVLPRSVSGVVEVQAGEDTPRAQEGNPEPNILRGSDWFKRPVARPCCEIFKKEPGPSVLTRSPCAWKA